MSTAAVAKWNAGSQTGRRSCRAKFSRFSHRSSSPSIFFGRVPTRNYSTKSPEPAAPDSKLQHPTRHFLLEGLGLGFSVEGLGFWFNTC